MIRRTVTAEVPGYIASLLELEAAASGRTVDEHLTHKLVGIYHGLHRICSCGFFVYDPKADRGCARCGAKACAACAVVGDGGDYYCASCEPNGVAGIRHETGRGAV